MPTPAELREEVRQLREMAAKETDPEKQRSINARALRLAQEAERIEKGRPELKKRKL
jgi:hypothetical protein